MGSAGGHPRGILPLPATPSGPAVAGAATMIRWACPFCRKQFSGDDAQAGTQFTCTQCKRSMTLPGEPPTESSPRDSDSPTTTAFAERLARIALVFMVVWSCLCLFMVLEVVVSKPAANSDALSVGVNIALSTARVIRICETWATVSMGIASFPVVAWIAGYSRCPSWLAGRGLRVDQPS